MLLVIFSGVKTISNIIHETCGAIYAVLKQDHLRFPQSPEEWQVIANDYLARWNYPNCVGALDGKHIVSNNYFCLTTLKCFIETVVAVGFILFLDIYIIYYIFAAYSET